MRDRIHELESKELGSGALVALITFTDEDSLEAYEAHHDLGFALLRDPDRAAYRAFGLGRGSLARVWGLRAARRYAQLIRVGGWRRLHRPTEDTRQLGGDFVIDPAGRLSWSYRGAGPDDRPTVDEIVAAVEQANRR